MTLPEFRMHFEPTTIEHLGHSLYTRIAPVIGELVSNSWDAEAEKVEITIPETSITPDTEIVVRDYGNGMNPNEINDAYLQIGRNCRVELGREVTKNKKRDIMGRKGIGKLAAFGVANEVELRSIKNGEAVCIKLNFNDMKTWPKEKGDYQPVVVDSRTGKTSEENGTELRIRQIQRSTPIVSEIVRKELARRFIIVTKKDFEVYVNGTKITKADRRLREDCKKSWEINDLPMGNIISQSAGWQVDGWIGVTSKTSQTERGLDIFVRGKAAELNTMFNLKTTTTQFARSYVVGEITANFLDTQKGDFVGTGRSSVQWETLPGEALEKWGQEVLKYIFAEWLKMQKKEKEDKIAKLTNFHTWYQSRTTREQKVAKTFFDAIINDENIEPESAKPLLEMLKTNIEYQAFQDLVEEIGEKGISVETLIKLFNDWRIIEAREHLILSDGRFEIIEQLDDLVERGALEVQHIQPIFEEHGWIVNPSWNEVTGQNRYSKLLREQFEESSKLTEKDRRIDILGYEVGGTLHVVEIKRPDKTLSWADLDQIERYVRWVRKNVVGTGKDSPRYATGLLIVGRLSRDSTIQDKQTALAGQDIRVETFRDLLHTSEKVYGLVDERLQKIAPEYSRKKRKERKRSK
ncbi:ATP-binding protein [Candidatus Nitrosotenuis chungbukensis]|uniref:ATP-binding protein n=1 Tax=Candidatus Nitrosotenuis chungbukensis TaxID=1353246 RepID=UPI0012FF3103|nr:ATP-binding protein [Candidatus Nitrosotenuis chungbukensis]